MDLTWLWIALGICLLQLFGMWLSYKLRLFLVWCSVYEYNWSMKETNWICQFFWMFTLPVDLGIFIYAVLKQRSNGKDAHQAFEQASQRSVPLHVALPQIREKLKPIRKEGRPIPHTKEVP
jgi:hypothetical protein